MQAKYGPLTSTSQGVQRGGEALPTFAQLCQRVNANKKVTVRDVWGLMLTALPGVPPCATSADHMGCLCPCLQYISALLGRRPEFFFWYLDEENCAVCCTATHAMHSSRV